MASCRTCGGELQPVALCPACEENVQWKCATCAKETDVSIHAHDGIVTRPSDLEARETTSFAAAA